jgi:DUF3047 family protein
MRREFLAASLILIPVSLAFAAPILIEDWRAQTVGSRGIPSGWTPYATFGGRPKYDFVITEDEGRRALHVASHDEHSTIAKEVNINVEATPILEWSWKIVETPAGADVRRRETSDLTGYLVVVWPRIPHALRSRLLAYAWGSTEPIGALERSRKTGTLTFVILRSGAEQSGRWLTERRNIVDDYRRVYGEPPEEGPKVVVISIDTNDTHSKASAFIGRIVFTGP